MLDIGGWEFLIVAFVLVMVVGPKELQCCAALPS